MKCDHIWSSVELFSETNTFNCMGPFVPGALQCVIGYATSLYLVMFTFFFFIIFAEFNTEIHDVCLRRQWSERYVEMYDISLRHVSERCRQPRCVRVLHITVFVTVERSIDRTNLKWITIYLNNNIKPVARKHSSRMRTVRAVRRMSSDRVAMRPIVNRMTARLL